jgi:hypothetical protein
MRLLVLVLGGLLISTPASTQTRPAPGFQSVPELGFLVDPDFFKDADHLYAGEASGVAVNSKGHIFLFQRVKPLLAAQLSQRRWLISASEGRFKRPSSSSSIRMKNET